MGCARCKHTGWIIGSDDAAYRCPCVQEEGYKKEMEEQAKMSLRAAKRKIADAIEDGRTITCPCCEQLVTPPEKERLPYPDD